MFMLTVMLDVMFMIIFMFILISKLFGLSMLVHVCWCMFMFFPDACSGSLMHVQVDIVSAMHDLPSHSSGPATGKRGVISRLYADLSAPDLVCSRAISWDLVDGTWDLGHGAWEPGRWRHRGGTCRQPITSGKLGSNVLEYMSMQDMRHCKHESWAIINFHIACTVNMADYNCEPALHSTLQHFNMHLQHESRSWH